ncbi:hypothetical protein SAMN05518672_101127 [Chitinophaga sp. CF118]|nr:hypothetical protein SAMN05518672_101127 [Chitinophaga sp. CF118]
MSLVVLPRLSKIVLELAFRVEYKHLIRKS